MTIRATPRSRGFTLLEAMVALLILAGSLTVLMQVQASSLSKAAKARSVSIAALLARSKMIDIEQEIFDEGFSQGEQVEKGDFEDEGYPDIQWQSRIVEIDLDIGILEDLCGEQEAESTDGAGLDGAESCASMLSGIGGLVEPVTQNIANSVRLVELELEWPEGRYKNGFSIKTLLTRDGFSFASNPAATAPSSSGSSDNNAAPSTPAQPNPLSGGRP